METWRNLKYAVGTRSGIMYGSCKDHKKCVDGYPPFRTILSALSLQIVLVINLKTVTSNKYKLQDVYDFATDVVDQGCLQLLGIVSLFTNISTDEITSTSKLF